MWRIIMTFLHISRKPVVKRAHRSIHIDINKVKMTVIFHKSRDHFHWIRHFHTFFLNFIPFSYLRTSNWQVSMNRRNDVWLRTQALTKLQIIKFQTETKYYPYLVLTLGWKSKLPYKNLAVRHLIKVALQKRGRKLRGNVFVTFIGAIYLRSHVRAGIR